MRVKIWGLAFAVPLVLLPVDKAAAADLLLPGKIVVVKGAKLVKSVSKSSLPPGTPFSLPNPGSADDPTLNGALLEFFDTSSPGGGAASFALDASGWSGLGNPPGNGGYKYKGKNDAFDPDPKGTCKIVLIKEKVFKATCKGSSVTLTTPFAGDVGVVLGIPAGSAALRYCARYGGVTGKHDDTILKRKDAFPPLACPSFCTGFSFAGACWFPGTALGASCDQTCADQGLVYDDATRTVAGSDGSNANCQAVLNGLSFPAPFGGGFACEPLSGVGCSSAPIDFVSARCSSPPTTGAASEPNIVRICACQ